MISSPRILATSLLMLPLAAQERARIGEQVPDFSFPEFLNGDGRQRLSDFFGQPVVIDFWGTRCPPCIGFAVPRAIKHDRELAPKGLITVLMERQGADRETLTAFLLRNWPENEALVCTGGHVPTPDFTGLPHAALIGVDGTLLWDGTPTSGTRQLDELIEAELIKVRKGWGDSEAARRMRALLYGRNDLAGARAVAATLPAAGQQPLLTEIDRRYAMAKRRVVVLRQQGRWLDSQRAANALQQGVAGYQEWSTEVAMLLAGFDGEAAKAGLAADKKVQRALAQLADRRSAQAIETLRALAGRTADCPEVAARAQRLLRALESPGG